MSRGLNRAELIGNLGQDAEQRFTQAGKAVSNFSVATTRGVKKGDQWEDETEWHRVTLWDSEKVQPYLTKGTRVYVSGRLQTRKWQDANGQDRYQTEIVASELILLGGKDAPQGGETRQPRAAASNRAAQSSRQGIVVMATDADLGLNDDDVPF